MFHEVPGVDNRRVCLVDHQQTTQFAEGLREDQVSHLNIERASE
jgi:hypothetical protein